LNFVSYERNDPQSSLGGNRSVPNKSKPGEAQEATQKLPCGMRCEGTLEAFLACLWHVHEQ